MNIKQTIISATVALTMVALVAPVSVGAITAADLQAQINALMAQLQMLQSPSDTGGVPAACVGLTFTRNLTVGSTGSDVKCLQALMNTSASTQVAVSGAGSPGNETSYFGGLTLAAVKKYQAQQGWTPANQVGPLTRAKLNTWLAGGVVVNPPSTGFPAGCTSASGYSPTTGLPCSTVTPVTPPAGPAGSLSVSLAFDTPASGSIPNAANGNFTKVTLTAGSGDVSISKMYITRTGLSSNSAVENIKVVDAMTGVYSGSIGSLNSDNRALVTFTQNIVVKANTSWSFYIKAGFVSSTTTAPAGNTAALGIGMASDITSNATSVMGTFPITGNLMSVVNLTIGTAAVEEDGATVDSKPNVGDVGVTLNNFKVTGSSTEAITIEAITMLKAGTVSNNYLSNLELWDVTNSKSLGMVASLNGEGKASWSNLNILIGKGNTYRFKIRTTIVDGPGLTANADIVDGTEVLIVVKGNTYGYYITPTATGSWAGTGTANQTINSGALVVSKSASTPATGNTSAGNDKVIAVFDLDARGESVKISSFKVTATLGSMVYTEVTSVAVYDESGNIVAGPKDLASGATVTFTDTFIVPVGIHKYTVKAKIADAVSASDTIKFGIADASTEITAKGMTSNSSITPTPATAVNGNTLTVKAAAMIVTTQSSPAGRSVALGTQDFLWASFNLSAVNSGEDVQVTAIGVLDTTVTGGDPDDLDNMALWADLTPANSARGDVYETKISNTENPTGNAAGDDVVQAFTLNQTVLVPMGGFVNVGLVASLNAGALTTGTPTHVLSIEGTTSGTVTSNGASTGTAITETYSSTNEQTMTNSGGGALTISKDASTPVADLILGNSTVTVGIFRLASSNVENLDVDDITLSVTGGNAVNSYWFYNGTTLLGSVAGGTAPKIVLNDGQLTVPANSNVKVTVKAMLLPVDGSLVTSGDSLTATIQGTDKVNTTGIGSGSQITSGVQSAIGNTMVVVEAKPTFALATGSPSGSLVPSTAQHLATFDVTASGEDDVTFSSGQTNLFEVNISRSSFTSDATAGNWVLKDGDGNTLSTISVADAATSVIFLFATKDFDVSPGTTRKLLVYGDTHEMTAVGNTIQLSLSDSADSKLSYSVNDGTTIAAGTKVFRGIIYAGSFDKK